MRLADFLAALAVLALLIMVLVKLVLRAARDQWKHKTLSDDWQPKQGPQQEWRE